jgi:hypothetical protein
MRGMLHHIDLTVKDPEASVAVYDAVLHFMGYTQTRDFEWTISDGRTSHLLAWSKRTRPGKSGIMTATPPACTISRGGPKAARTSISCMSCS